jgi:hypothetical protein
LAAAQLRDRFWPRALQPKRCHEPESDSQEIGVQTNKGTRWLIAFAVLAAAIMELVDTSAVNVSLPLYCRQSLLICG